MKAKRITTNGFLSAFPNPMRRIIRIEGPHVIVVPNEAKEHRFVFDNVFGPNVSEEQSYQVVLPQLLDAAFSGKSSTLLSLGGGGNTSWILGKDQLAGQIASPSSPSKVPKPAMKQIITPSPSLVRIAVGNILTRLSIPGSGFIGLSFSSFEIYNDQVNDLLSKKKLDPREHTLPGLSSSPIRNMSDFEDALTLVLLNGKIRNGELRSHIFFRFTLLSNAEPVDKNTQLKSPKVTRANNKPETPKGAKTPTKSQETPTSPVLDMIMLAPYNSAAKEFLSSEQNAIKRSLLNLSHLVDKMNGDVTSAGISWRSFKLTQILQPTFTSPSHRLVTTVHSYGHKTKLLESLKLICEIQWSFTLLDAINRLNETNSSQPSSAIQSPKQPRATRIDAASPVNTPLQQNGHSDHHDPSPAQWRPSGPSPPRPPLPRYASDTSFTSTSSIPLNSSKLKHLKLNKRVSVSDLTKTTNGSDETHVPSEGPPLMTNGFVSVSDLEGGGEGTLMRAALSQSKTQNAQLLANHAQLAAQLEAKLRQEKEQRVATEESLQKQLRKEREKRERTAKRLQNAEQLLDSKEKEVVKLSDIVDKLASESGAKLAALERIVKTRNESYRAKSLEQEGVIKRHNLAFKSLQDRVSDLIERKVLEMKQNKTQQQQQQQQFLPSAPSTRPSSTIPPALPPKNFADRESLVMGSGDVLGVVSGNDVSRSEDEYVLLQKLQRLIEDQVQDLSVVNQRIETYEQDKPFSNTAIEASVLEFESHITSLREQVTEELKEYLDNIENDRIIAQLNQAIKQLAEGFNTKIVVNAAPNKEKSQYSELVGEIEGDMEATDVLRVVGQQLRSTVEDQAESFVSVLEDMEKLTDEELSEELRLPITWEPMRQDLQEIQERLRSDAVDNENPKSYPSQFIDLSSVHQWLQDQRLLFAHQRSLLDQICHKVIQVDEDDAEGAHYQDQQDGEEGEEMDERDEGDEIIEVEEEEGDGQGEEEEYREGDGSDYDSDGKEYYSNEAGSGEYSSGGEELEVGDYSD